MLKSCKYCGRIHDSKYDCEKKPRIKAVDTQVASFRRTNKWKEKSIEIRERDRHLCQVCLRNLYLTDRTLNYDQLSVHHIIPASEAPDRRLDNRNLITLCGFHHELAESGFITRDELMEIVSEQEG